MKFDRRKFLRLGTAIAGAPLAISCGGQRATRSAVETPPLSAGALSAAKVAIASCRSYKPEVKEALERSFDLLGGIGSLVRGKTVAVKVNLTCSGSYRPVLGKSAGETYVTHGATAYALAAILLKEGARRVRFMESAPFVDPLEEVVANAGWEVKALQALGNIEFENTRNLGVAKSYAHLPVPGGGHLFSAFELNHSYQDADVFVSLAKLKNHETAGVTLTIKNLFGITPNSLYGNQAPSEYGLSGRLGIHNRWIWTGSRFPGEKGVHFSSGPGFNIPRVIADLCAARPVDLAIIDGIAAVAGGEGPWAGRLTTTEPGILIAGLNPVSTDAVAVAVMGYPNPRAARGVAPFADCDNHLLLAEQLGVGTADLGRIDVRGLTIDKARYPYST
jgi:uncharacterized protein (DUF362 family)